MERRNYDDPFLASIPLDRKLEIDAMLKKSEEEIKKKGLTGLMTLEEFTEHMNKMLGRAEDNV